MQVHKRHIYLKDTSVFATGGGDKMPKFFGLQNAKSQDWSVVGNSNLFWLTLRTLPALFGVRTPPKSMCTQRHTRLKIFDEKWHFSAPGWFRPPVGCQMSKLLKTFQLRSNYLRNWFIALPCTSNWFYGLNRENSEIHFFGLFSLRI